MEKRLKILITGSSGFIGTSFISKFYNDFDIISVIRDAKKKKKVQIVKKIKVETTLIEDKKIIKIIKKHKPAIVLHLANFGGVIYCEKLRNDAFKVNVNGVFNVISGCLQTNAKLIFISSREVYGETLKRSSFEEDTPHPNNVLGITKLLGENMIKYASKQFGLDFTIIRASNVYGINGTKLVVDKMINSALQKKKIFVNGGNQRLNLIHVNDLLDVIKLVIQKEKLSSKQILNAGSNDNISIKELAEYIAKTISKDVKIEIKKPIKEETSNFKPSIKKLKKLMGFVPKVQLKKGINEIISNNKTHVK